MREMNRKGMAMSAGEQPAITDVAGRTRWQRARCDARLRRDGGRVRRAMVVRRSRALGAQPANPPTNPPFLPRAETRKRACIGRDSCSPAAHPATLRRGRRPVPGRGAGGAAGVLPGGTGDGADRAAGDRVRSPQRRGGQGLGPLTRPPIAELGLRRPAQAAEPPLRARQRGRGYGARPSTSRAGSAPPPR